MEESAKNQRRRDVLTKPHSSKAFLVPHKFQNSIFSVVTDVNVDCTRIRVT